MVRWTVAKSAESVVGGGQAAMVGADGPVASFAFPVGAVAAVVEVAPGVPDISMRPAGSVV